VYIVGQLGDTNPTNHLVTAPLKVNLPQSAYGITAASLSSYALMADGTIYAWYVTHRICDKNN
jgi:hypothetical protein